MLGAGTYDSIDTGVDRHRRDPRRADLQARRRHAGRRLQGPDHRPSTRASSTRGAGRRWPRRSWRTRPASGSRSSSTTSSRRAPAAPTSATRTPATARATATGPDATAAEALVDWLATDPTGSGDPDFLIIGDLNSYAKEDPIDAIKPGSDDVAGTGDDYTNLIEQYMGTYAYSYVVRRPGRLPRPRARQRRR